MEQDELKDEINSMKKELNKFSIYMPQFNLKNVDEIEKVKASIRE
jgi:ribosomal protein L29